MFLLLLLDYTSLSPGGSCSTGYVPQSGSFVQDTCGRIRRHFIFVSSNMTTFIHLFIHISINPSNVFVELLKQSTACFLCLYWFPSFIVKCPRGMYYNNSSSTCEKCPVGFISTAEGSFKCEACPSMKSTEREGSKICMGNSIFLRLKTIALNVF